MTRETEGGGKLLAPACHHPDGLAAFRSRAPKKEKRMMSGRIDWRDFDETETRLVEVGGGIALRIVAPSSQEADRDAAELEKLCEEEAA